VLEELQGSKPEWSNPQILNALPPPNLLKSYFVLGYTNLVLSFSSYYPWSYCPEHIFISWSCHL